MPLLEGVEGVEEHAGVDCERTHGAQRRDSERMSELFFLDRQPLPIFLPSCSSCCQAEASGAPASGSGVPSTGPSTATGRPRCVMMYRTLRSRTRRTISYAVFCLKKKSMIRR